MARRIVDILPVGEQNAVPRRQLASMMGISERHLRRRIAAERRAGALILSTTENGGGYFRPGSVQELRRFVASMSSRGRETFAALEAARTAIADTEGAGEKEV